MAHVNLRQFLLLGFALVNGFLTPTLRAQTLSNPATPETSSAENKLNQTNWNFTADPSLPNVLIIGDSISIGYTLQVRDLLKSTANVYRPMVLKNGLTQPGNCMDSASGFKHLNNWLGTTPWKVIHFNFGLHDLKYIDKTGKYVKPDAGTQVALPDVYEKNLRDIVVRLKQTGAVLIWASTTPVPANTPGRVEGDERVYNQVAEKVMRENNIQVDDLYAAVAPRFNELAVKPGNVHFNDEGYRILATSVADAIKSALGQPRK